MTITKKSHRNSSSRQKKVFEKHPWLSGALAALVLVTLVLSFVIVVDARKIDTVEKDINDLYYVLKESDFEDINLQNECWRTQSKFGTGSEICETKITGTSFFDNSIHLDDELDSVNERLGEYIKFIDSYGYFEVSNSVDEKVLGQGLLSTSKNMPHKATGISCGRRADYSRSEHKLSLTLSCITTPWLSKVF